MQQSSGPPPSSGIDIPRPRDLLEVMMASRGFPYATYRYTPEQVDACRQRDRALVSLQYVAVLKMSDLLKLRRRQVRLGEGAVGLLEIPISSGTFIDYRPPMWLPLEGETAPFTRLFLDHFETLEDPSDLVFAGPRAGGAGLKKREKPIPLKHAWEVVDLLAGPFSPYFRAID